jgi:hypothetical protein
MWLNVEISKQILDQCLLICDSRATTGPQILLSGALYIFYHNWRNRYIKPNELFLYSLAFRDSIALIKLRCLYIARSVTTWVSD